MMDIRSYHLPPTKLIPNSPRPLLHYRGYFSEQDCTSARVYDAVTSHGWQVYWISRYGATQKSHYHSWAHECMVVLSGQATIRFGVADTSADPDANTHGARWEQGGIELAAKVGDLFILPAGTAHKTFDPAPAAPFQLLTPHDAHQPLARDEIANTALSGFTMMGAYPIDSMWDFATGGEDEGQYERVWSVPVPEEDPVLGCSVQGLCGRW